MTDLRGNLLNLGDIVILNSKGSLATHRLFSRQGRTVFTSPLVSAHEIFDTVVRLDYATLLVPTTASDLIESREPQSPGYVFDFLGNKVYLGDWAIAAFGDTALVSGTASDFSREGRAVINSVSVQTATQLYRIPCRIEHLDTVVEL